MKNLLRLMILLGILIPMSSQTSFCQFDFLKGTGYGVTGWYSWGNQTSNDSSIKGYGVNVKYSLQPFFMHEPDSIRLIPCKCGSLDSTIKWDTTYTLNASFGLGYYSYSGLSFNEQSFSSKFNIASPYAGIWFSLKLPKPENPWPGPWVKHLIPNIVLGATVGIPSAADVPGIHIGPGGESTRALFSFATTSTFELNVGLTFFKHIFFEYNWLGFKATGIKYTNMAGAPLSAEIYGTLPTEQDFSFNSYKLGLSLNF